MDREIFYPSEQPTDTMLLQMERNKVIAQGYLAQATLGTSTVVDGLACIPTVPASLAVQIGPGSIYSQVAVDTVAYGTLGTDTVDQIIKQGISLAPPNLTLVPPVTSGQAINYLIQAQLSETDTGIQLLNYFNSAAPLIPWSGAGGSGVSQPTIRQCSLTLTAKSGVAATAGSQATPAPDAGYVGLWVVTVANGATQLTSAQISQYSGAPFIAVKLPNVPAWTQAGSYAWGVDTGSANQINVALNPVPASITAGFTMRVRKVALPSTGPMTIIVNGASAVALTAADASAMSSTQIMPSNFLAEITFDGTIWRFMNGITTSAVGSLTANAGEGITVNGSAAVSLNYPGLSVETVFGNTDLWSFFSQADSHHRVVNWLQLLAAVSSGLTNSLVAMTVFNASGTWTKNAATKNFLAIGLAPGGAGGSAQSIATNPLGTVTSQTSGGGGAGGGFLIFQPGTGITTEAVTIGSGGTPVSNSQGGSGGPIAFGPLASASAGSGGFRSGFSGTMATYGSGGIGGLGALGTALTGIVWRGAAGANGGPWDGGAGGSSLFGAGGAPGDDMNGLYGVNGGPGGFGAGGGGVDTGGVGGTGGGGMILILEFC